MIQEQQELIKLLQEQKKVLIQECQAAGRTLPQIVMEHSTPKTSVMMSSLHSHPQSFPPHPPQKQRQSKVVHRVASHPVSLPPPPPLQVQQPPSTQLPPSSLHSMHQGPILSPPMSQHPPPPVYPNVSPESCTPPSHLTAPVHKQPLKQQQQQNQQPSSQQQLPPYTPPSLHPQHLKHLPPPTSILPVASSQHNVSLGMNMMTSSSMVFSSQCPPILTAAGVQMLLPGGSSNTFLSNQPPHPAAAPPIPQTGGMPMMSNIGRTSSVSQSEMMPPPGALVATSRQPFGANDHLRTDPNPIMRDLTFSPLTSSEFKELEQQNMASFTTNPMVPFDAFPDDLENIVNIAGGLPTAGYGVGVLEEDSKPPQLDLR